MAFQVACRAGQRHRGFKTYCERDIDDGADTDGEQAAPAQDELDYDGGGDADEGGNRRSGREPGSCPDKPATARMPTGDGASSRR
jgi:hypothetical protein